MNTADAVVKVGLPYDKWLHWSVTSKCNLKCSYCISTISSNNITEDCCITDGNDSPDKVLPIDVDKVLKTLKSTGLKYRINFSGGEPFLIPNIIEVFTRLSVDNYLAIVSNLINNKIDNFIGSVNPSRILHIIASVHILELKRLNLTSKFISNFKKLQNAGFSIFAQVVAHPTLIDNFAEDLSHFKENGIELKYVPFLGKYNEKIYPDDYSNDEKIMFQFSGDLKKSNQQLKQPCNAGFNVAIIDENGEVRKCFSIPSSLGNIYEKITFSEKMVSCPVELCGCPFKEWEPELFASAISLTKHMNNTN